MTQDRIVSFYSGGTDDRQRTLDEILGWSDESLEDSHDYIQWLFPNAERSRVNPSAPLATAATAAAFAATPALRDRLRASLDRMLSFYGLRRSADAGGAPTIGIDQPRFRQRAETWLRPFNHNHLRLTRIMQSLDALGLRAEAKALQRCLLSEVVSGPGRDRVTADTVEFWTEAVR